MWAKVGQSKTSMKSIRDYLINFFNYFYTFGINGIDIENLENIDRFKYKFHLFVIILMKFFVYSFFALKEQLLFFIDN